MFRVKICGITSVEDALLAAEAGADAIGLNFYEKSPRYVTADLGRRITRALHEACENRRTTAPVVIGVFVHPSGLLEAPAPGADPLDYTMLQLFDLQDAVEFRGFQFHGNEPAELIATIAISNTTEKRSFFSKLLLPAPPVPAIPIIRAFRCENRTLFAINKYLRECDGAAEYVRAKGKDATFEFFSTLPTAVLLDAHQRGSYGGTGQVADWNMIRQERDELLGLPLILAGGLTPENVAGAIATARPDAVDVASGVESAPGKKDPVKVRAFVAAAKKAFAALDS